MGRILNYSPTFAFLVFFIISMLEMRPVYSQAENQERKISMMFDPVGFLTLGPSVYVEPAFSPNISLNAGLRFQNMGLMQVALFGKMKMSYTVHTTIRYYVSPKERIDGFFIAPGLEFGQSNYKSDEEYKVRALGGQIGYKWIKKSGFTFELTDTIGSVQSKEITSSNSVWGTDLFVFYMLSFKIGKTF